MRQVDQASAPVKSASRTVPAPTTSTRASQKLGRTQLAYHSVLTAVPVPALSLVAQAELQALELLNAVGSDRAMPAQRHALVVQPRADVDAVWRFIGPRRQRAVAGDVLLGGRVMLARVRS